jgi:hypothetical protein
MRVVLAHPVTWSINSVCHTFGKRPFRTTDRSRNVAALALLSLGESWHNAHHAFPSLTRHGVDRRQIDLTAACIARGSTSGWCTACTGPSSNSRTSTRVPSRRGGRRMRRTRNADAVGWSLTPRSDDDIRMPKSTLPRHHVLGAVARRGLPGIVEASLVPSAIFLIVTTTLGAATAMIAVLVWGYANIFRRALRGRAVRRSSCSR